MARPFLGLLRRNDPLSVELGRPDMLQEVYAAVGCRHGDRQETMLGGIDVIVAEDRLQIVEMRAIRVCRGEVKRYTALAGEHRAGGQPPAPTGPQFHQSKVILRTCDRSCQRDPLEILAVPRRVTDKGIAARQLLGLAGKEPVAHLHSEKPRFKPRLYVSLKWPEGGQQPMVRHNGGALWHLPNDCSPRGLRVRLRDEALGSLHLE